MVDISLEFGLVQTAVLSLFLCKNQQDPCAFCQIASSGPQSHLSIVADSLIKCLTTICPRGISWTVYLRFMGYESYAPRCAAAVRAVQQCKYLIDFFKVTICLGLSGIHFSSHCLHWSLPDILPQAPQPRSLAGICRCLSSFRTAPPYLRQAPVAGDQTRVQPGECWLYPHLFPANVGCIPKSLGSCSTVSTLASSGVPPASLHLWKRHSRRQNYAQAQKKVGELSGAVLDGCRQYFPHQAR
jgi:hypothetical protein